MPSYLISWKPSSENKTKGWPVESLAALAEAVRAKGRAREPWRFSRVKDVSIGERVYLVQQGKNGHAILGYGRVAAGPVKASPRRVPIDFEALVDPRTGQAFASHDELHAITTSKGVWDTNASGIRLPEPVERQLESLVIGRAPIPVTPPTKDINPDWTRDELILALDLYLSSGSAPPAKNSAQIQELSNTLNQLGKKLFGAAEKGATFRNANGVYMKLMNFRRLDPRFTDAGKKGLSRGAGGEKVVWREFAADPSRCHQIANAIRASIADPDTDYGSLPYTEDEFDDEAPEGRLLTRKHRVRERNRKLVKKKLARFLKDHGRIFCQLCKFDFASMYGKRGEGFIECHHTKPVTTLGPDSKTHLDDLALVCANCHRMIHRRRPWLSLEEIADLLRETQRS